MDGWMDAQKTGYASTQPIPGSRNAHPVVYDLLTSPPSFIHLFLPNLP
jgi:hypothetical protein